DVNAGFRRIALWILSQNFGMFSDGWVEKDDVNVFLRSSRLRNHTACEAAHLPQFFDGSGLQDDKTTGQRDRADGVRRQRPEVGGQECSKSPRSRAAIGPSRTGVTS